MQEKAKISPKHVFLHLFSIVMLYVSTVNFITLIFQYVNVLIPDKLSDMGYPQQYSFDLIRSNIAAIIVVFPLLILVSWLLNKNYKKEPLVKEMKTRKWLIYFTLFAAALIIVADLSRIIWVFLGGEITIKFILKAASIFLVSAVIFGYYLQEVRQGKAWFKVKYFVLAVSAIILITVVTGFFLIGSPQKERVRRFDQQRISDLQSIQGEIINYWQRKQVLPSQLADLMNDISGYKVPLDPQNATLYEYIKTGDVSFRLCATFNLQNTEQNKAIPMMYPLPSYYGQNWDHAAGRVCFDRTIDKQLYPLIKD